VNEPGDKPSEQALAGHRNQEVDAAMVHEYEERIKDLLQKVSRYEERIEELLRRQADMLPVLRR